LKKGYKTYLAKMKKQSKFTYCSTKKKVYIPKEPKKKAEELFYSNLEVKRKEVKEFSEWFSDIKSMEQLYDYIISQENKNQK